MKQTCDICQRTRKGKHFGYSSNNVLWCDDCRGMCSQPHLLPPVVSNSWHPGLKINLPATSRLPFYMMDREEWAEHGFHPGVITNGDPLNPPQAVAPPKPRPAKPKGPLVTSTDGYPTEGVERLKLQLKYGLNDDGKPFTDEERAIVQKQIDLFETEPDEDEEAAAIASILGQDDRSNHAVDCLNCKYFEGDRNAVHELAACATCMQSER